MSLQAISWALDASQAAGNDRLVMIVMCHYTYDDGFSGLSKAVLADETRLSEPTIIRAQQALLALQEIERGTEADAPDWWLGIARNRRPALFKMVGFLGSQYATPVRRRAAKKSGVSLGSNRGDVGVSDTPPDLGLRDAISEQRTETNSASHFSSEPTASERCIRCRGEGRIWSAHAGVFVPCPCVDGRPLVAIASEGAQQ